MPVWSFEELEARMARAGASLPRAHVAALGPASLAIKRSLLDAARGRPYRFGRQGVRYTVNAVSGAEKGDSTVWVYGGAMYLSEKGSYKHPGGWTIAPKRKRGMRFPDGQVRTEPVQHPPLPGRPYFDQGVRDSERRVLDAFEQSIAREWTNVFGT